MNETALADTRYQWDSLVMCRGGFPLQLRPRCDTCDADLVKETGSGTCIPD